MNADWLDQTLRARVVVDDGFSDRVVAVATAHGRTRLILRVLVALLSLGALAAAVAGVISHAAERLNGVHVIFGEGVDIGAHREAFVRDWQRLSAHPLLVRRASGDDASERLKPPLTWPTPPCPSPCPAIDGLRDVDTWLTAPNAYVLNGIGFDRLGTLADTHLHGALARGPQHVALAVADIEALGRLLLSHNKNGAHLLAGVAFRLDRARAAGLDIGDARASFSREDAQRLSELWLQSAAFVSAEADDEVRRMITESPSVLSCGAHTDWSGGLAVQAHVGSTTKPAPVAGCRAPAATPASVLCSDVDGLDCAAYLLAVRVPGISRIVTALATPDAFSRDWFQ